jgi:cytochrome c oxidase assembly protein subunit 15
METGSTRSNTPFIGRYRYLLLATSLLTYLLIVAGGAVCATGSARGCPDWPGCYGQVVPPPRVDAIIEYVHRFIAALTGVLILTSALVGWIKFRPVRWLSRPVAISIPFLIAVVVFGALAVLRGLSRGLAVVDVGSALTVLALTTTATVVAFSRHRQPGLPDHLSFAGSFIKLVLGTAVAVFIILVSGILVAGTGSTTRCLSWPLYGGALISLDPGGWLQTARWFLAAVTTVAIVAVVVQAWRTQRSHAPVLWAASTVGALFLLETILGLVMMASVVPVVVLVIYVATAGALLASLVVLAAVAGLASPLPASQGLRVAPMAKG